MPVRSPEHRRLAVERLAAAWEKRPELRFGQLLRNALDVERPARGLLFISDEDLVLAVETFVAPPEKSGPI